MPSGIRDICVKNRENFGGFGYLVYICSVNKNIAMLGIKNNEEILYGQYADTLYEEYKKRYGEPIVKDLAN